MKRTQKFALSNVSKVIAVSIRVAANLQKIFPQEKIVKIPNGIGTEKWIDAEKEKICPRISFFARYSVRRSARRNGRRTEKIKRSAGFRPRGKEIVKKFPETYFRRCRLG